jgi:TPR repeat protein
MNPGEISMKTRHLVLTAAAVTLLAACTQSGFRNADYTLDSAVGDINVVRVSTLEKQAIGGNAAAQRMLGSMYYWGEHVDQNETKAVAWWSRAADKGDAEAQLNLTRITAGEPIEGEMHADIGRQYWASAEEGYFAFTDNLETMILPFRDASLGEDIGPDSEPSVLEKILSPIGKALEGVVSAVSGS